jgi:hypothetical protein
VSVLDDPRVRAFLREFRRALVVIADAIKAFLDSPQPK